MSEFRCYGFTPARYRTCRARLRPPFHQLTAWSLKGLGYLPLIAAGRVILSFSTGAIAAYDESIAALTWRHDLPRAYVPLASSDGAYLLRGDQVLLYAPGELRVLAIATGELLDCQPVPEIRLHGAVLDDERIVCHFWDKALYLGAYDTTARSVAWQVPVPLIGSALVAAEGVVCYLPADDTIAAVDLATGKALWNVTLGDIGCFRDLAGQEQPGITRGTPVAVAGLIITAVMGHHVLALDLHTGAQRWLQRIETLNPYTLTAYADERLYVLGDDRLDILDARSGAPLMGLKLGPEFQRAGITGSFTHPGVTDEYIYCGDFSRSVLALHKYRGTVDWTFRCRSRLASGDAPLVMGNRLYVVDGKGNLYVFESAASS